MVPHIGLKESNPKQLQASIPNPQKWRAGNFEWPQFRGPDRDGHAPDQGAKIKWRDAPSVVWEDACGVSHSSIITSESLLYTLEQIGDEETLTARNIENGKISWKYSEKTRWDDMMSGPGPRSTPTLHGDQLIILFSNGTLAISRGKKKSIVC